MEVCCAFDVSQAVLVTVFIQPFIFLEAGSTRCLVLLLLLLLTMVLTMTMQFSHEHSYESPTAQR